jgi:two-component system invasion response regulator UvrY
LTRVLLIDDHEVLRDGVKRIFDQNGPSATFGDAATAAEAVRLAAEQDWDLVILDVSLRGRSGLDVLRELKQLRPRTPVLMLSMHSEAQYARRAFKSGAAGYITKDSSRSELARAIRIVLQGHKYVSPQLADALVLHLEKETSGGPHELLSVREFEVLRLIASGNTVSEIAAILGVSDKTISTYRARLLEKMGLRTNAGLTRYAFANGLIE